MRTMPPIPSHSCQVSVYGAPTQPLEDLGPPAPEPTLLAARGSPTTTARPSALVSEDARGDVDPMAGGQSGAQLVGRQRRGGGLHHLLGRYVGVGEVDPGVGACLWL